MGWSHRGTDDDDDDEEGDQWRSEAVQAGWNFDIYILCYTVLGGEDGATWLSVVV